MQEMNGSSSVSFRGVRKHFTEGTNVVDDLDLNIRAGEFLTLLGPSGSGKTTTLMMLAGFEKPTGGDILVAGQSIVETPPSRRNIGMVFQSYALFPHMTVAENVAFPLKVRGRPQSEVRERTHLILTMVGMEAIADRRPSQLSGGQQQRVAVARALVFEPHIVLMDEPLAALDKQLRERMQMEIRSLHDKVGVTTVYVTHDQTEALTMSDRIAVFDGGRIQQVGEPNEVYEHPANEFVAGFIGDNNMLRGVVSKRSGKDALVDIGGNVQLRVPTEAVVEPGTSVMLAIRPERVSLGAGPEVLQTTIQKMIYAGDRLHVHCVLPGGQAITATSSEADRIETLRTGDNISLALPPEHCRLFPQ
ncbi:MAG: ABC transporter ATP-binding protein [Rhodovibrionaceae bacterium]